jgi:diguanylate cyclase (GGDEF)-like protein/PAS domain S-box-containing protein
MGILNRRQAALPSLVAVLLVAIWMMVGYQASLERERVLDGRELELSRLVVAVEEQTLRLFKLTEASVVAASQWIEEHPDVDPASDASFVRLVGGLTRLLDDAVEIVVLDPLGNARKVSSPMRHTLVSAADREYFKVQQRVETRGLFVGNPLRSYFDGRWMVPVSYPVRGKDGKTSVVVAGIHLEHVVRAFEAQRQKPDGSITVITAGGVTLWRAPAIEGAIGKSIAATPDYIEHHSARPRGLFYVKGPYDGVERMVGHARLAAYPVIVAVTFSQDDMLGPWRDQLRRMVLLMVIFTVAAISVTVRSMRMERAAQDRLAQSERRFRRLIEHAPDAITVFDIDAGRIVDVNRKAEELFGCTREQLLSDGIEHFYAPVQPDGLTPEESVRRVRARALSGESVLIERIMRNSSGKELIVEVRVDDMSEGKRRQVRGSFIDISARKRAEVRLQLAASVFTHAREGILITDAAGDIVDVNDTFSDITGYSRDEALGRNPRMLKSDLQGPEFFAAMWRAIIDNGCWTGELWNRRKNGELYAELLTISDVRDASGSTQHYVGLFSDITPMKEHQRQLEDMAHFDALTGLPNRVLLADRLRQAISQARRRNVLMALVYLDLDGFKAINDSHGHEAGDDLLIAVSKGLKDALRVGDTLARLGGDEFVAILVDLSTVAECETVLCRLLQAAARPVDIRGHMLRVSASLGVTLFPLDDADADSLLRHADQAMYLAKQSGKNRFHLFDVDHDAAVAARHESLERIRVALSQGEFVLHYQPKVNMRTGTVIGVEALIRWQHPERGLLPPAEFLPVIEDHEIGVDLGEWVIDTALTQIGRWRADGHDIPISVNIGARQLQQMSFLERLASLLAAHPDVAADRLELEILETSALEDVKKVGVVMRACGELGIRFALDDFGTGYSSLTYLKRLPAELLKIDQSFVRDMLGDPDDLAIVRGVIGLAAAFGRKVIAEGVETPAHGVMLLPLGCELAQGYGIARPMPAADIPAWADRWRPDPLWLGPAKEPAERPASCSDPCTAAATAPRASPTV